MSELKKLAREHIKTRSKEDHFIENGKFNDYKAIKSLLIKENIINYECQICGLKEWCNKKITLQLDHINGVNTDNRLENLRFLCPNCHSQTDTYCGRNLKRSEYKENKCISCGIKIHKKSTWCKSCKGKNKVKINWPSVNELLDLVQKNGFTQTGRILGVSDNAVRKRLKNNATIT